MKLIAFPLGVMISVRSSHAPLLIVVVMLLLTLEFEGTGPDYKQMGKLKQDYPGIPIIALTATANDRVKSDVLSNLGMRDSLVLTQSFNRPNLKYEVRPKTKKVVEDIATFITKQHHNQCGIIYCSSKAKCEETADKLRRDYKIEARHYHAVRALSLFLSRDHSFLVYHVYHTDDIFDDRE